MVLTLNLQLFKMLMDGKMHKNCCSDSQAFEQRQQDFNCESPSLMHKWLATQTDSRFTPLPHLHRRPPVDLLNNLIRSKRGRLFKIGKGCFQYKRQREQSSNWRFLPKSRNNGASKKQALRVWVWEKGVLARTAPCCGKGQPVTDWSHNKQKWQKNHLIPLTLHGTPIWRINVLMVNACKAFLHVEQWNFKTEGEAGVYAGPFKSRYIL